MEIIDPEQKKQYEQRHRHGDDHVDGGGKIIAGLIIIAVGILLFARQMGFYFPGWIFSWQMLLIVIGLFIGARHGFRPGGWLIPILIGGVFLIDRWIPDLNLRPYFWPVILILIGMVMILSPGRRRHFMRRHRRNDSVPAADSSEEIVDAVSIFGGVKKNVISKNFRGGNITCIFGGSEVNLSQADIHGTVYLEINQVFGGSKLIVPSNWQVQSNTTAILGSVEDTRVGNRENLDSGKVLVLEGVSVFGGVSIKSF